jgi:hypothetical protein
MLAMMVHAAIPVIEIDDRSSALMFLVFLFLGAFRFHFGSVFSYYKSRVGDF